MHAPLSHRDNTEKTILLGPLDTFPVGGKEVTLADALPSLVRLESGVPVQVVGAKVVVESLILTEEERFLMKPSYLLRFRREARGAVVGALAAVRRPGALATVLARFGALRPLASGLAGRVRAAGASVAVCARSLNRGQRRLTAGAFAAGVTLASFVALVF